jgi:DNA-binding NarL/FixJ family response regulator
MTETEALIQRALPFAATNDGGWGKHEPTVVSVLSPCRCMPCASVRRIVARHLRGQGLLQKQIALALNRDRSTVAWMLKPRVA